MGITPAGMILLGQPLSPAVRSAVILQVALYSERAFRLRADLRQGIVGGFIFVEMPMRTTPLVMPGLVPSIHAFLINL
jgi:hypothetical protein